MHLKPLPDSMPLDKDLLRHLEQQMGQLPEDYARFLLTANGGEAVPELSYPVNLPGGETEVTVLRFEPVDCLRGVESIDLAVEMWELYFGKGWIPLASDGCGNDYLMSLEKTNSGAIYFRDHEEVDEDVPGSGLTLIAGSFSELVAGLRESS